MNTVSKIVVGLCEGRHPMPCEQFIFGREIDRPMDFEALQNQAYETLWKILRTMGNYPVTESRNAGAELVIYATE